ncbi:hypothetical protein P152DRAFT_471253 [Eremomyces bilateralis CBS 781.70]|uniref:Uncharacterized protein n=1 Tax=Eremomyces bilateralis CBS 781.70 TaxID=1392243 RepID=A0A6G1GCX3_9PEZI|nr:uncharacterized protein P152DRAFT_471253 [Eremomyces bilateralis CBS 781.70]KAF1815873.1 hypothetical protein P152DRAFT_471253 [Eremomyces bilateralis CBS 781.70]
MKLITFLLASAVAVGTAYGCAEADRFCHRSGEPCGKVKRAANALAEAVAKAKAKAEPDPETRLTTDLGAGSGWDFTERSKLK